MLMPSPQSAKINISVKIVNDRTGQVAGRESSVPALFAPKTVEDAVVRFLMRRRISDIAIVAGALGRV